jgi:hypothetical protein
MKNLLKLTFLLLMTLAMSCSDDNDNCDGVECGPGVCNDGTCECPAGYEGDSCETISNAKYYGIWITGVSDCGAGNSTSIDSIEIAAHPNGNINEVQFTSFAPSFGGTIDGTIVNGNLAVAGDITNYPTTITGTFASDTDLDVDLSAGFFNCTIAFAKN